MILPEKSESPFDCFSALDIRVGTILEASSSSALRNPAYILHIDFGELGVKRSCAQLAKDYKADELMGRQVIAVVNFAPKQIGNMMSECLVLAACTPDSLSLLGADRYLPNGTHIA